MQKNHFLLLFKKFKNTESAQHWMSAVQFAQKSICLYTHYSPGRAGHFRYFLIFR